MRPGVGAGGPYALWGSRLYRWKDDGQKTRAILLTPALAVAGHTLLDERLGAFCILFAKPRDAQGLAT
jgi:hypothetical protein